jgi:hypothetical protein
MSDYVIPLWDAPPVTGGETTTTIPNSASSKSDSGLEKLENIISSRENTECAPTVDGPVCFTDATVKRLAINFKILSDDKKEIVEHVKSKVGCGDNADSCLISKVGNFLSRADLERFNPTGPWNSTNWLSNDDIDGVLSLYEKKFPRFKHIPFQMRDFQKSANELSEADWEDIYNNYDAVGWVFNTDTSGGPGQHWVSTFIDLRGGTVEFFDSAGRKYKEFTEFVIETTHTLSEISGKKFRDVFVAKIEHQKKNTECGVYSLYFILSRLHGIPYTAFEFTPVPDDQMVQFRKYLFRNA